MRLVRPLLGLAAAALLAPLAVAQRAPLAGEPVSLPFFDVRFTGEGVTEPVRGAIQSARTPAAQLARQADLTRLSGEIMELRLDDDELFGTPHFLRSTREFLSAPINGAWTATGVVSDFVAANRGLFEVEPGELASARMTRDFGTAHNGLRHLTYQQQAGGLDILGAELKANVTARGELINISSTLLPRPADGFGLATPRLSAEQAIVAGAAHVGLDVSLGELSPVSAPDDTGLTQTWTVPGALRSDTPPTSTLVAFPLTRDVLHPAWTVVIAEPGVGNTYEISVDATDGTILRRDNRLRYLAGGTQDASFNVWTDDSPAPGSPGLSTPSTSQFPVVPRTLVTVGATAASPEGWIPDGANETLGNNVDAHLDLNNDNAPDLPRPQGSPFRVFDFPVDLAQSPTTYRDAAVTQLFYYCNDIHDVLYGFGFDEQAVNFQNDNFGLGGVDGDAISADAQDGGGTNNANWNGSGTDGSFCWIQMYVFDGPSPDRDGDFDGDVVYHEYLHGVSIRLSGGTVSTTQAGGMGEGWGDFFGVCMSAAPSDDPEAEWAMGGYITKDFLGTTENYYFGIRRYPYGHDLGKSPLTYADIDPAQQVIPAGIPNNSVFIGNPANSVHNAGEIWCNSLLECRSRLWLDGGLGFAANDLIMQLVIDGMKLMPSSPNMLEARDAILAADLAGFGGAHLGELWAGFAYRGMGDSASSPGSSTTTGIVEAFDIPSLILFATPAGTPAQLFPGVVSSFPVEVSGLGGDAPFSGTGQLHYAVNGGGFNTVAMSSTGTNTYSAQLPGLSCFDSVEYFVSSDSTAGTINFPSGAPGETFSAEVYTSVAVDLDEAFEANSGWTVGDVGDGATTGIWERGDPVGTAAQPEDDHTVAGSDCFFTGQGAIGGGLGDNDIDGGVTTLRSPLYDMSSGNARVSYWRWYSNNTGAGPNADVFEVDISNNGGSNWTSVEVVGPAGAGTSGGWVQHEFSVDDLIAPTANMQLRFRAGDLGEGSLVEAALDDLQVFRLVCEDSCQSDLGFGGPGDLSLSICGPALATGASNDVTVSNAAPFGQVFLALGLTNTPTPFKGGTLVTVPLATTLAFTADGSGTVAFPIAGGNGPLSIFVQAVAPDGSQLNGFEISNAVEAVFLP